MHYYYDRGLLLLTTIVNSHTDALLLLLTLAFWTTWGLLLLTTNVNSHTDALLRLGGHYYSRLL